MRILHVVEAAEGGVSLHLKTLAQSQRANGHSVAVALPARRTHGHLDPTLASTLQSADIDVEVVPFHSVPIHPRNIVAGQRLRSFLRAWQPSVVHSHSTTAGAIARPLARNARVPTVHTPNGVHFAADELKLAGRAALALERLMDPFTDSVIAVSSSEAVVLRRAYRRATIEVVRNAFPAPPEPPPPFPKQPRVVSVGRLVRQKHPELAVDVLARVRKRRPAVGAELVGQGGLEPVVRDLISRLDPAIELVSTGGKGLDAIGRSSVVLLTSRWEGAPYVPLEAMALGRPIVATDVIGSRDVVVHDVTGYTFSPHRPDDAADRIVALVDDPPLAARMGAAGRQRLSREYALDDMVTKIERIYVDVTRAVR